MKTKMGSKKKKKKKKKKNTTEIATQSECASEKTNIENEEPIRRSRPKFSACTEMIELQQRQEQASQLPLLSQQLSKRFRRVNKGVTGGIGIKKKKRRAFKKETQQDRFKLKMLPPTDEDKDTDKMTIAEEKQISEALALPSLIPYDPLNRFVDDLYSADDEPEKMKSCQTLTRRQAKQKAKEQHRNQKRRLELQDAKTDGDKAALLERKRIAARKRYERRTEGERFYNAAHNAAEASFKSPHFWDSEPVMVMKDGVMVACGADYPKTSGDSLPVGRRRRQAVSATHRWNLTPMNKGDSDLVQRYIEAHATDPKAVYAAKRAQEELELGLYQAAGNLMAYRLYHHFMKRNFKKLQKPRTYVEADGTERMRPAYNKLKVKAMLKDAGRGERNAACRFWLRRLRVHIHVHDGGQSIGMDSNSTVAQSSVSVKGGDRVKWKMDEDEKKEKQGPFDKGKYEDWCLQHLPSDKLPRF